MIKPATVFTGTDTNNGEVVIIAILAHYMPRPFNKEEEARTERERSSVFMLLYDKLGAYEAEDELMYHQHEKSTRQKMIRDLHRLVNFYESYDSKTRQLTPADYLSKQKGETYEMNYMLFHTKHLAVKARGLRLQQVENPSSYLQLIQDLRSKELISNRHHRKLKDFVPFIPTNFLPVHTPTLSL